MPTKLLFLILSFLYPTKIRPKARIHHIPHPPIQACASTVKRPILLSRHLIPNNTMSASNHPANDRERAECLLPARRSREKCLLLRLETGKFGVFETECCAAWLAGLDRCGSAGRLAL